MRKRYARWIGATAVGELVGFAIPAAAWGAAATAGLSDGATAGVVVAAGAGEGAVLAYAQSRVLRRELPALDVQRWIALTAAAGSVSWAIGMVPSTLHDQLAKVPVVVLVPLGVVGGSALLSSIGVAQALELRRHVPRAWRWVPANVLGWIAGLPVSFIAMGVAPEAVAPRLAFAVAGGLGMGAAVGAVTGRFLGRLLDEQRVTPDEGRWCEGRTHRTHRLVLVHHRR